MSQLPKHLDERREQAAEKYRQECFEDHCQDLDFKAGWDACFAHLVNAELSEFPQIEFSDWWHTQRALNNGEPPHGRTCAEWMHSRDAAALAAMKAELEWFKQYSTQHLKALESRDAELAEAKSQLEGMKMAYHIQSKCHDRIQERGVMLRTEYDDFVREAQALGQALAKGRSE